MAIMRRFFESINTHDEIAWLQLLGLGLVAHSHGDSDVNTPSGYHILGMMWPSIFLMLVTRTVSKSSGE
jgi:hypothetical protein